MRLKLKNIAKIREADVAIDGITVIAGENDTGKSTVGKALWSIFNSFNNLDNRIYQEKKDLILHVLENLVFSVTQEIWFGSKGRYGSNRLAHEILSDPQKYIDDSQLLYQSIKSLLNESVKNLDDCDAAISNAINRILSILAVSDDVVVNTVLQKKLNVEFNNQVNNIYVSNKASIEFTIKKEKTRIEIEKNNVVNTTKKFYLETEAIYLDDPFVLDSLAERSHFIINNHQRQLRSLLLKKNDSNTINEIVTKQKINKILDSITEICDGEIIKVDGVGFRFSKSDLENYLDIRNISSGLKTFVILKMLLENGVLEDNGTVVLDEPEIHLHPEWQLRFAELIVLIQKEFNMHILVNTHSPYFLNAIQVYSAKHRIADRCNYYLAHLDSNKTTSSISDVTNEIEVIYNQLARPLQTLENEEC